MYALRHFLNRLCLLSVLVWLACACGGQLAAGLGQPQAPTQVSPTPLTSPPTTPTVSLAADQIQPAQVAGTWYPADPAELTRTIDRMLAAVEPVDGRPIALIVPHAGYVFSGNVAAYGFRQLQGQAYDTAVIIASDHQLPVSKPISIWPAGGFATPLGVVPVDAQMASALMAAEPRIKADRAAFAGEHVIEIELPFLQRTCPTCQIVPLLMGSDDDETVQALARALIQVLAGHQALIIASSDLSHYPSRQDAQQIDGATLAAIETGDAGQVRAAIQRSMQAGYAGLATCACGEAAILVAMQAAAGLGADTVTLLRYANSADSEYGDASQVVGYGAVMLWRYQPPQLSEAQRRELLKLARTTIRDYLQTGRIPDYQTGDATLARRSGVFVTLKENGELRGCIGQLRADRPLYRSVQEMAVAAATSDTRFVPLTLEELQRIQVEISILSPMRRISDPQQIEIGTHGLLISKYGHQGVFLPQVPVEQGWTSREQYLDQLCLKASLPTGCWREGAALYTFTALVIREEAQ